MSDEIDPMRLPYMPFDKPEWLPEITAVYFALSEGGEVLYIGATHNLRQRWPGHHALPELKELQCVRLNNHQLKLVV